MSDGLYAENMISDLAKLCMGEPAFEIISSRLDIYCPFDALRVSRQEIRHSNFLADILDPARPHGFGDVTLRSFLDVLFSEIRDDKRRLDLHLGDIGNVEIRREWKNIDLICLFTDLSPPLAIVCEIKLEAGEHGDQLCRYETIVQNTWSGADVYYFFLTPNGAEPSRPNWAAISFATLLSGLSKALDGSAGNRAARMMLSAYVNMMRRRYVPNDELEELARQIWTRHGATLEYLIAQKPNIVRDTSLAIQSDIIFSDIRNEVFSKSGIMIELDSCSNTYTRIYVPTWDNHPDQLCSTWTQSKRVLLCELELYGERAHIRMMIGPGDQARRNSLYDQLSKTTKVDLGRSKTLSPHYNRLAAKTIWRIKNIDEKGDEDLDKLVKTTTKGVIDFLAETLPAYDSVLSPK